MKGCAGNVAWLSSITSPIYLHRLRMMMVLKLTWLQRSKRCWLEMVLGQKIRKILRRFLVWKVDSWLRSRVRWEVRSTSTVLNWSREWFLHFVQHSEGIYGLYGLWGDSWCHSLLNHLALHCPQVEEFFDCLKIFSVHLHWRGVWDI